MKTRKIISGRFLETELDPLYNLVKVVQDNGADIQTIELADSKEPYSSFIDLPDVQKITSKENLLHSLKVGNSELVSYLYMNQLAEKINQVKNERFLKDDLTTIITFFNKNLTPRDKSTPRIDFELREEGENNRDFYFSNSQFSD